MKRDLNLVRQMMLALESDEHLNDVDASEGNGAEECNLD
jgi:hypothetical protein